jgi:hypothetical protein
MDIAHAIFTLYRRPSTMDNQGQFGDPLPGEAEDVAQGVGVT